jgi:hypothetical protein
MSLKRCVWSEVLDGSLGICFISLWNCLWRDRRVLVVLEAPLSASRNGTQSVEGVGGDTEL